MWRMLSKCTFRSGSRHILQLGSKRATFPLSWRLHKHITYSPQWPMKVRPYTSLPKTTTTKLLPISSCALEEESLLSYRAEEFFPVHLGDTIKSRYHVIGKLGYGANSTVWFCRDIQNDQYVIVKVYLRTPPGRVNREKAAYEHLANLSTTHPGHYNVRQALDIFDLSRPKGAVHVCVVHAPLQCTLYDFQRLHGVPQVLPEELAKMVMSNLLETLDFLHTEANLTHCDLKLSNIMLRVEDESIFADYEKAETHSPSDRKSINGERTIYASRTFRRPRANAYGQPVLCDFGEARIGVPQAYIEIQPEIYKAPEILMQFEWGHSVDIWNAACLLWEMLETEHLFDGSDSEGLHNNRYHMNEIVGLLGEPPQTFLRRSPHASRLFDETGKWNVDPPITSLSLELRSKRLEADGKAKVVDFLQCMLRWIPEERLSAKELLQHPWLSEDSG